MDGHILTLEDPGARLTLEEILHPDTLARFTPAQQAVPNFSVSGSAFWGHFRVSNPSPKAHTWWLDHADAMVSYSDFFLVRHDGRIEHTPAGSMRPWSDKPLESTTQTLPVRLAPGETLDIFLRIESDYVLLMPLTFWQPTAFHSSRQTSHILHGVFVGVTIAMMVYNLFVFTAVRDTSYLLYVAFLFIVFINTAGLNGTLAQYVFPDSPAVVNILFGLSLIHI